jgi:PKD domain
MAGVQPTITLDNNRQLTGQSYRVFVQDPVPNQGLLSNVLTPVYDPLSGIVDFGHCEIHLSVWFPSAAQNAGSTLTMYLISQDGDIVPLSVPAFMPDHWHELVIYPPANIQSGRYQLGVVYVGNVAATFWIDAVEVFERAITWSARATPDDNWTDFRDVINSDTSGISFTSPGTSLQLRAQAHQQAGTIFSAPNLVPVYAELGRAVFPEDLVPNPYPVTTGALFTQAGTTVHPATLSFSAVTSYAVLTSALTAGAASSALTASVGTAIPANSSLSVSAPDMGSQTYFSAPGAILGASSITVTSEVASKSWPIGSIVNLFAPPADIISYQWSFGDGGAASGPTSSHIFPFAGSYNVSLTMIDTYGGRNTANADVTIT